jgi:hypothetical protein
MGSSSSTTGRTTADAATSTTHPQTRDEVITRFLKWCDYGPNKFPTEHVKIDGKILRVP